MSGGMLSLGSIYVVSRGHIFKGGLSSGALFGILLVSCVMLLCNFHMKIFVSLLPSGSKVFLKISSD